MHVRIVIPEENRRDVSRKCSSCEREVSVDGASKQPLACEHVQTADFSAGESHENYKQTQIRSDRCGRPDSVASA